MMMRRFVNLVVDAAAGGGDTTAYNLYRVAASALFSSPARRQAANVKGGQFTLYSNTDELVLNPDDVDDAGGLPPPAITFHPSSLAGPGNVYFLPLSGCAGSSDDDSLLALDVDGRALLYGAASAALRNMPDPCKPKIAPISFTAGDGRLYVIERVPFSGNPGCFEALTYGQLPDGDQRSLMGWYWRSLPPPPLAEVGYGDLFRRRDYDITASAVFDDTELWVTAHGAGTFSFDTKGGDWMKLGEWHMPFKGRGEYVEEHDLWFGLSSSGTWRRTPGLHLCSCHLFGPSDEPVTTCLLDGLDRLPAAAPPKQSFLMEAYAVHLGSGKVCIARFMEEKYGSRCGQNKNRCLLLTGVELS
ncbi:hypothetical protein E2562_038656 [Oryza meyeriana var. granulata]|uniref:DUF1618 domain-containing protein n=1 Tax=Oryza meyeriana var. granulata TaxID=110450 RepID=A0A6G1EB04_9ORYZ|nr:hypothetical protein E2562_038656 [Oryza meyeriana var. granulata]